MKLLIQILFYFFIGFTNSVNAITVFTKVTRPSYEFSFSTTENQKLESEVKIDIENFARSDISENSISKKANLKDSYVLKETYARTSLKLVNGAGNWLDDLDILLGAGSKTKINGWINNGLSESKLQTAFANSTDKAGLLNKLETSKSVYHQRVHIADWDNIPGIAKSNYVNNSLPKQEIPASNFGVNDADYNLPSYRAATFTENVELITLPENTKLYRVTDVGGEGGAFWTLTPPSNLDDVIGGAAVMPEWNGFSKVVEYTVPSGGIKVWKGKAAAQPISENPLLLSSPNMLDGGEFQVFLNDIVRDQSFKDAIIDVTSLYKSW